MIKTAAYMIQGRPVAHVTGIRFVLLHDTMILLAVLIAIGLYIGWSILADRLNL